MFPVINDAKSKQKMHSQSMEEHQDRRLKNVFMQYCDVLDEDGEIVSKHYTWLEELLQYWASNDQQSLDINLDSCFDLSLNPCRTALFFCSKSPDFYQNKNNTFASYILRFFKKWIKSNESKFSVENIPKNIKLQAFDVILKQKNTTLTEICFDVFNLQKEPEVFLDGINDLLLMKRYKEAAVCARLLHLESNFDITQIAIPLLFQDKANLAEKYLENSPEQQKMVVVFLDNLCSKNVNYNKIINSLNIPNVAKEKSHPKMLKKLASRLMKKYNIPAELCPNICQINNSGALKYLLYKKYTELSMEDENWDEMVEAAIGNDPELQKELVISLRCYNDMSCAAKYANKFNIALDFPTSSATESNLISPQADCSHYQIKDKSDSSEDWDKDDCDSKETAFHELNLPMDKIHFINNELEFKSCLKSLQNTEQIPDVIGIDTEWKPTFGLQNEKVSILQLATRNCVFIMDIMELQKILADDDWKTFFSITFCNHDILKLGFGIKGDLKVIYRSIPCLNQLAKNVVRVLDLQTLAEKILSENPSLFPHENKGKGLSGLVSQCLGKPLNKTEQFSNWERRPLRDKQLYYAALDVYCLLEIYDMITSRASEIGFDLISLQDAVTHAKKEKEYKNLKENQFKQLPPNDLPSNSAIPNSPESLKVVVDNMLQGLGRKLRLCGVDVKILENDDDHEEAVKIALREKRIILTSGMPFQKLNQYVPEGMCYNVKLESAKKQAAEVFEHFNIKVTSKNIFSRCQICNGDHYIKVPSSSMKSLWDMYIDTVQNKKKTSELNVVFSFDGGNIDGSSFQTDSGAVLCFKSINEALLKRVKMFFVCAFCGKIYWIGIHWQRTKESLATILVDSDD